MSSLKSHTGFVGYVKELHEKCSVLLLIYDDDTMYFAHIQAFDGEAVRYQVCDQDEGSVAHERVSRWEMIVEVVLAEECYAIEESLATRGALEEILELALDENSPD